MKIYQHFFKPLLDKLSAILGLIVIFPIFILTTLLLAIANKGKPFFIQERGGKNKTVFKIIKFKTMNDKKDANGNLLPDKQRLTKIGNFVRNTSLDEIPQLINIIKGDMSLIGPRPMLAEYLSIYNDHQIQRLNVKPGITGWAQINGRNNLTFNKKFDLDIWYINNLSFKLDIKILFLTLIKIFSTLDVNQDGNLEVTAEKFNGKN
ncbi:lipopolysaccharide/colanic/teichoic acid biosynthesis glycosyltransferase [Meridianimaribacter flavus]|uniref:Lipopolysaccharide/colanic/teichoic acid biosynthesis glycosyltransferase n=1 Tax=Meridianimaribacter flavus TaxID=571115 RepID=A0ABY2G878_9FLAO|nr:lipopolysaccharide/colanic/teichoic acid biosynthesis glycosyltransferase [Meridianimaribacter flavus]